MGPANATQVLAYWAYENAVYLYNDGYASTIAVALAAILSVAIAAFVYMRKKGWDVGMIGARASAATPRPGPRWLAHLPLVVLVVFSVTPLLLLILNSVKSDTEIKASPLGLAERLELVELQ